MISERGSSILHVYLSPGVLGRVQRAELAITDRRSLPEGSGESYQRSVIDDLLQLYGRYRLLTFDRDPVTSEPTVEILSATAAVVIVHAPARGVRRRTPSRLSATAANDTTKGT